VSGRLEGKVAIVTGSASGFGKATAIRFSREGARVIVSDVDEAGGKGVADGIVAAGVSDADFVAGDVSDLEVATELARRANERFGQLDILVNNAGITHGTGDSLTWDMDEAGYDRMLKNNLRSVYTCCKAAIPSMLDAGAGSIVNITSIAVHSNTGGAPYGAAKGGMLSYARHLAGELAQFNIRINCVSPGFMVTPATTGERQGLTPEEQRERVASFGVFMPMGHAGSVDDIANAVLFLASDEAGYITGQELVVDGGYLVRGNTVKVARRSDVD
jgi:3-oxoacyl-[acyl-carrier protein] reductase